jgi:hypothetical protein
MGEHTSSFVESVASDTNCYVTVAENGHRYCVLIAEGTSTADVFDIAMVYGMVCVGTNQLRAEEFGMELWFKTVDDSDLVAP